MISNHGIFTYQTQKIKSGIEYSRLKTIFILITLFIGSYGLIAQPSGGPYGPISKTYELPKVSGNIFFVSPNGIAEVSGTTIDEPTTIESAIERVKTGDAIIMRGGIYRTGNLILNQGITIQPYKNESPVLKGTYFATEWEQQENGLWITTWEHLFPAKPDSWWRRHRHGSDTPQHLFNNDMVFVDGRFLKSAGWEGELDETSFYINYETQTVYLKIDPRNREVEITAFNVGLLRTNGDAHGKKSDGIGPIVRGITFTQYAYRAVEIMGSFPNKLSDESEFGKDVVGSTFEDCTFSFCSRAAGYFYGDNLTIRNCKVSDTSTEGLYILSSSDVLLERNILTRNNIEVLNGYYPAAVKIFNQCYRVTCRDNLVIDHENSVGIWYDVGNVDGIFINNWIQDVTYDEVHRKKDDVWPNGAGFYFEISKGAVCAGNVFINCDAGIHLRNAADVEMFNNTFVNSQVLIGRTARTATGDHFDWHPSTGPGIDERFGHVFKNNILYGDKNYRKPLLSLWQPADLCGRVKNQQMKELDNNAYVRTSMEYGPLLFWSPIENEECRSSLNSLGDLRKLNPNFSFNSLVFNNYAGPLFKSTDLRKYELLAEFPGSKIAVPIPADIGKVLGETKDNFKYIGAYPPKK